MDQTGFSLLVGLIAGMPICLMILREVTSLSLWACVLLSLPGGFIPATALTFVALGWLGRLQQRKDPGDGS